MPVWHLVCQAAAGLESALMPKRCVFCGTECRREERLICCGCDADLPRIGHACTRCAQPASAPLPDGVNCGECQRRPPPYSRAIVPLAFEFPVDAAIRQLKFRRRLVYAPAFGEILCEAFSSLPGDIDALLPVPLHWRRHAIRGFNQAEEICRPLRTATGLPLLRNVVRVRPTPFQSGLSAKQRRHNLEAAFDVRGKLSATHVLIVDDVVTTGETCRQIARLLLDNGVERVSVLAIARA